MTTTIFEKTECERLYNPSSPMEIEVASGTYPDMDSISDLSGLALTILNRATGEAMSIVLDSSSAYELLRMVVHGSQQLTNGNGNDRNSV